MDGNVYRNHGGVRDSGDKYEGGQKQGKSELCVQFQMFGVVWCFYT